MSKVEPNEALDDTMLDIYSFANLGPNL